MTVKSFNNIAKLHMILHYLWSIWQFGTPNGYNTKSLENLHIIFAKEPWKKSNKKDPLEQMCKLIQCQEARAHLGQLHGPGFFSRKALAIFNVPDQDSVDDSKNKDDKADEHSGSWEDVDNAKPKESGGNGVGKSTEESNYTYYPNPRLKVARTPTKTLRGSKIIEEYQATNLTKALKRALSSSVWHQFCLYHCPLSFAPHEDKKRDVVWVQPAKQDNEGNIIQPGVEDTVLFLYAPGEFGIDCYCAARVRVIFTLPAHLCCFYPHHLAYVKLFTGFNAVPDLLHGLHTLLRATQDGGRLTAVIPITDIVLACHLAPQYKHVPSGIKLDCFANLLSVAP
ncbi:hypothetical protein RhiTH_006069 [Rhizoctonia solani]